MKKVLYFSGSFDPIHNGHLAMLKYAIRELKLDKIVVIVTNNAPLKTGHYLDACKRFELVKLALHDDLILKDICEVSNIDLNSGKEYNYSVQTLSKLINKDEESYFMIGSDQVNKFEEWKDPLKISKLVQIIALKRKSDPINVELVKKYDMKLFDVFDYKMSSTEFRNFKKLDVPFIVLETIYKNKWYWGKLLFGFLKTDKYLHSLNVANISRNIALSNKLEDKLSLDKIYRAALLHDIGKYFVKPIKSLSTVVKDIDKLGYAPLNSNIKSFDVRKYNDFIKLTAMDTDEPCIHAVSSMYLALNIFNQGGQDDILEAIYFHCTANDHLSTLAKLIYSADKVDVRVGREGSEAAFRAYKAKNERLYGELCKNLDKGFVETLDSNIQYLMSKNPDYIPHNPQTDKAVRKYCSESTREAYFDGYEDGESDTLDLEDLVLLDEFDIL